MLAHHWPLPDIDPFLFSPRQRKVLKVLVEAGGRMLPVEELKRRVWGRAVSDVLPKVMIHHIRKRLGPKGSALVTVWGGGYRWIP